MIHIGRSIRQAMLQREMTYRTLSACLGVPIKKLRRTLKRRDIGLLALMELLFHLEMQLDDLVNLSGYFNPGATPIRGSWPYSGNADDESSEPLRSPRPQSTEATTDSQLD